MLRNYKARTLYAPARTHSASQLVHIVQASLYTSYKSACTHRTSQLVHIVQARLYTVVSYKQ
jgi:hypothetical protein